MKIPELIYSTVTNTCARCHQGKVFENTNPYNFKNAFKLKNSCSECNLKYEKEPGFFYGSLYVSYALSSGFFMIWFFIDSFWLHMDAINLALIVTATILLAFPLVHQYAKLIWLNFFVKYDKKYAKVKQKKEDTTSISPDTRNVNVQAGN